MITALDIGDGEIKFSEARHTTRDAFYTRLSPKSKPAIGDILVTKDGTLGRTAIVDHPEICINQSVAVLRPSQDTDASFVLQFLRSPAGQRAMLAEAGGSTIKHIYITKLAEVMVPCPQISERHQITKIIAESEIHIRQEEYVLRKLCNLKSGLMTDLLDGRVRVPATIATTP
jgi:type I restriction enzyme S subunit